MSRSIYFVTHPDVVIDPMIPVPQWPLSAWGRSRMRCLLSQNWMPHVEAIIAVLNKKRWMALPYLTCRSTRVAVSSHRRVGGKRPFRHGVLAKDSV
jgi:hypothetical protein